MTDAAPAPPSLEPPAPTPGVRTSEFWIAVGMLLIGTYLTTRPGLEAIGAALIAVSGLGYNASRTLVKREPRRIS